MSNFQTVIKELRNSHEWSQRKLGQVSGVSNTEIGRIENGTRPKPSLKVISKLASAFGITVDELLARAGITQTEQEYSTPKKPRKLLELIQDEEYTLNGQVATPEDREKISRLIEALYYDAKEKNKRK